MEFIHRENTLIVDDADSTPGAWGENYTVVITPIGAIAASASSGTTITVYRGHGFAPGDRILINPGSDNTLTASISDVTATTILFFSATYTIAEGDVLVNLGPDTSGSATPQYDGSPMTVFEDPAGSNQISNAVVTADSNGKYHYYHKGSGAFWELYRDSSGAPLGVIKGHGGTPGWYNVCDFGLNWDGSTNNSARLKTVTLAVPDDSGSGGLRGGTIYFPPGKYYISSTVTCTKQNIRWLGSGGTGYGSIPDGRTVLQTDQATLILLIRPSSAGWGGHIFENIEFKDTSGAGTATGGLRIDGVNMCSFLNCNWADFTGGYGLYSEQNGGTNQYWTFFHPRFYDCLNGIVVEDSIADWSFFGGRFVGKSDTFRANQTGIKQTATLGAFASLKMFGTTFNDLAIGVNLDQPRSCVFSGVRFEQGATNDGNGTAVDIDGTSGSLNYGDYNTFDNCDFVGWSVGVDLGANCDDNRLINCRWAGCTTEITDAGSRNAVVGSKDANDGSDGVGTVRKHGLYYAYKDVSGGDYRVGFNATAESTSAGAANLKGIPVLDLPDNKGILLKNRTMQQADTDGGLYLYGDAANGGSIGVGFAGNGAAPIMQAATGILMDFNGSSLDINCYTGATVGDTPGLTNSRRMSISDSAVDAKVPLISSTVTTLADDATPSVSAGNLFKTGGTTTITDFDDGVVGQTIHIESDHAVTITHNASIIVLSGSANFVMADGDTLTLTMFTDQIWTEVSRMVV